MTTAELKRHLVADLYRYDGAVGAAGFLKTLMREPGFRFVFLLRLCRHLRAHSWTRWGLYHIFTIWFRRLSVKLHVYIDPSTEIGPGLYLGHAYGIMVNRRCIIGANCSLSQLVTLGLKSRGATKGCPTLCDRVYVGPGAVILGRIVVEDDSAIGANSVVTRSVPTRSVVVGAPGKVISSQGSQGYVTNIHPDYPSQPTQDS